ncbi:hypothetical protein BGX28_004608 [Mortierella sp. GBA30]|nr:hypothetical protein BGX28_004608 [Mortierella sp. GBA30]
MAPLPIPETLDTSDQDQLDQTLQQTDKTPLSQPSAIASSMATVRHAASRMTDMLGIGHLVEPSTDDNSNSKADGYSNERVNDHEGHVAEEGRERMHGLSGTASNKGNAMSATTSPQAPRPPLLTSSSSSSSSSFTPAVPDSDLSHLASSASISSSVPSTFSASHSFNNLTERRPQSSNETQLLMDTTQPDLMTMEAFQMNNGAAVDYEAHDITGHSYMAGPGSFPDSFAQVHYNHEIGPLDKDSAQNSDSEDALGANISFVYANEKRFSDFHALFRSVPDDEKLIEDYGCALQKEILVQGRLYISEHHVCFNANIFGWVTNLVIAFSEITAIEKRLTAFVIPNAISIITTTNTKGHFFASFLSRDAAHDLLMAAWRKSFPCAANASAINNNVYFRQNRSNLTLNDDDDDADSFISARAASDSRRNRHRRSSSSSQNWTADEADWDETEDMDGRSTTSSRRRGNKKTAVKKIPKAPNGAEGNRTGRGRSASELPPRAASFDYSGPESVGSNVSNDADTSPPVAASKPRDGTESLPTSLSGQRNSPRSINGDAKASSDRSPTICKCSKDGRHYANTFLTETYPGSMESTWKLLFDSEFNKNFLTNEAMKGADVQEEPWQKATDGTSTKITKYTKWLGMPIGPKTTKAILTDVCENKDFEDYVTTVTTTSTPDVPSGGSFTTKCRTCITWAGPNRVQVVVTGAVEFTKSSWIKGQIEKGAAEGMSTHYKELNTCIRKHVAAHPEQFGGSGAGTGALGVDTDGVHAANGKDASSIRRRSHHHRKSNGDRGSDQTSSCDSSGAENGQPFQSLPAPAHDNITKAGLWSNFVGSLSWNDGENVSHLALVGVLMLVMVANIYIWFKISSVTSQIEKIQSDVLSQRSGTRMMYETSGNSNNNAFVVDRAGTDEGYAQEQEDAMWGWLTEREERYRRNQQTMKDRSGTRKADGNYDNGNGNDKDERAKRFPLTEAKLQARINELQQQLEILERSIDQGAQGA